MSSVQEGVVEPTGAAERTELLHDIHRRVSHLEAVATPKRSDRIWDMATRIGAGLALAAVIAMFSLHERVLMLEAIGHPPATVTESLDRLEHAVQANQVRLEDVRDRVIRIEESIKK